MRFMKGALETCASGSITCQEDQRAHSFAPIHPHFYTLGQSLSTKGPGLFSQSDTAKEARPHQLDGLQHFAERLLLTGVPNGLQRGREREGLASSITSQAIQYDA